MTGPKLNVMIIPQKDGPQHTYRLFRTDRAIASLEDTNWLAEKILAELCSEDCDYRRSFSDLAAIMAINSTFQRHDINHRLAWQAIESMRAGVAPEASDPFCDLLCQAYGHGLSHSVRNDGAFDATAEFSRAAHAMDRLLPDADLPRAVVLYRTHAYVKLIDYCAKGATLGELDSQTWVSDAHNYVADVLECFVDTRFWNDDTPVIRQAEACLYDAMQRHELLAPLTLSVSPEILQFLANRRTHMLNASSQTSSNDMREDALFLLHVAIAMRGEGGLSVSVETLRQDASDLLLKLAGDSLSDRVRQCKIMGAQLLLGLADGEDLQAEDLFSVIEFADNIEGLRTREKIQLAIAASTALLKAPTETLDMETCKAVSRRLAEFAGGDHPHVILCFIRAGVIAAEQADIVAAEAIDTEVRELFAGTSIDPAQAGQIVYWMSLIRQISMLTGQYEKGAREILALIDRCEMSIDLRASAICFYAEMLEAAGDYAGAEIALKQADRDVAAVQRQEEVYLAAS